MRKVQESAGISEYRLDNGLRVLLAPQQSHPTFTLAVTYFAGSRHERENEAGMAHLVEHMVFRGTPQHADIRKTLIENNAGFGSGTSHDRAIYYEILPATTKHLAFALNLEADRMANCDFDSADIEEEMPVVRAEIEAVETDPAFALDRRVTAMAYERHTYAKSIPGTSADLNRIQAGALRAFYRKHYQPDNALLVLAGGFDPETARMLIEKFFGDYPRPARTPDAAPGAAPVRDDERTVVLRRSANTGLVGVLYHGVPGSHEDFAAQEALVHLLTAAPAGRLHKALVEKGEAESVGGSAYARTGPGVLQFSARVRKGKSLEDARDRMIRTIEEFAAGPIRRDEFERFKAQAEKDLEEILQDDERTAIELSEWGAVGDWRLMFIHRDRIRHLTAEQIRRAAWAYLIPGHRTVGLLVPVPRPPRAALQSFADSWPDAFDTPLISRGGVQHIRTKAPDTATAPAVTHPAPKIAPAETIVSAETRPTTETRATVETRSVEETRDIPETVRSIESRCIRMELKNGMKVALVPTAALRGKVKFILTLHAGSESDIADAGGGDALVAGMLPRGSRKHTSPKIRRLFDEYGAKVSFEAGGRPGEAVVRGETAREHLPGVIGLVSEILKTPAFRSAEFYSLKKEIRTALEGKRQDPAALGWRELLRKTNPWPKGDVRYVPTFEEEIARLRTARLSGVSQFHRNCWGGAAEISLMGDMDVDATKTMLEKDFGGWTSRRPHHRIATPYQKTGGLAWTTVLTPDKRMAAVGISRAFEVRDGDTDDAALELLHYVLAASPKSRLRRRLRQNPELAGDVFSHIEADPIQRNGHFFAGVVCEAKNADQVGMAIREVIEKLLQHGVGDDELTTAKRGYQRAFDNKMSQSDFVLSAINAGLYDNYTLKYPLTLNDRIQSLTPARFHAAIRKYLQPDRPGKKAK